MIKVRITLKKKKNQKNKTYPIIFKFTRLRRKTERFFEIHTEYSVYEDDFDSSEQEIKKSCKQFKSITRINNTLLKRKATFIDTITKLHDENKLDKLSNEQVKRILKNKNVDNIDFFAHTQFIISKLKKQKRIGNASVYQETQNFIAKYSPDKEFLPFEEITPKFLKDIEDDHIFIKNLSYGGLSVRMRTIRSVIKDAIREGIIDEKINPFDKYTIKHGKPDKRAYKEKQIVLFAKQDYEKGSQKWLAQKYLMFSFHCIGLGFSDMAYLKKKHIKYYMDEEKNRYVKIYYVRKKLVRYSKVIDLVLIPEALAILNDFGLKNKDMDDFIFPILTKRAYNDEELALKDIKNKRKTYNEYLKIIQKELGFEKKLTSNVSRHSWASIARDKGISLRVISQAYNHNSEKTTQTYVDSLDPETIHEYNKNLLK